MARKGDRGRHSVPACSYELSSPPPRPPCSSRLRPMPLRCRPRYTTVGESAFIVPCRRPRARRLGHRRAVAARVRRLGRPRSAGAAARWRSPPGERLYAVVGGAGTDFTGGSSNDIERGRRQRRRQRVRRRRRRLGYPDRAPRLRDHAGEPARGRRRWRRSRLRRGRPAGDAGAPGGSYRNAGGRRTARDAVAGRRRRHGDRGRRERDRGHCSVSAATAWRRASAAAAVAAGCTAVAAAPARPPATRAGSTAAVAAARRWCRPAGPSASRR